MGQGNGTHICTHLSHFSSNINNHSINQTMTMNPWLIWQFDTTNDQCRHNTDIDNNKFIHWFFFEEDNKIHTSTDNSTFLLFSLRALIMIFDQEITRKSTPVATFNRSSHHIHYEHVHVHGISNTWWCAFEVCWMKSKLGITLPVAKGIKPCKPKLI